MKVAKLYDKISSHYSDFDYCDVLAKCNKELLDCIDSANIFNSSLDDENDAPLNLVDLGAGDGRFLEAFSNKYPHVKLTGLDISSKMLELAKQKINFEAINIGIEQASLHLTPDTYHLATANFVCAYVGLEKLLAEAKNSLKSGGYICITTSTFESFKTTQQQVKRLSKSYNPFKRFVGFTLLQAIGSALVPSNYENIVNTANKAGFTIKKRQQLMMELNFENGEEFLEVATRGGWIVTLFQKVHIPSWLLYNIAKMLVHTFSFPFKDQCIVEVVMLQKDK